MEPQQYIMVLEGVASFLMIWVMKSFWDELKEIRKTVLVNSGRLNKIDVLIAGTYLRKDEFTTALGAISNKLDRLEGFETRFSSLFVQKGDYLAQQLQVTTKLDKIMDKLDGKADR